MVAIDAAVFYNTIIGFYISINDIDGFKKYMNTLNGNKKIDVCVSFDGVTKEFSIDEFMNKLGWEE